MARNGSGTYTLPSGNPVIPGTVIESTWANDTMTDLAAALTQSIAYDGQTTPIANLPMGGYRHLNVGDPTVRSQYASLGMVQDGRHMRITITGGIDNLTGTLPGGATSYIPGTMVSFFAPADNTGPMTLNYNGIGALSLVSSSGLPLAGGEIIEDDFLIAVYDGTKFKLITLVESEVPTDIFALSTSGQERPPGGSYSLITINSPTSVNVPAGAAWVVPPGALSASDAVEVSWLTQVVNLTNLATAFSTTLAVDETGAIVQIPGRMVSTTMRNYVVIGVVEHVGGTVSNVVTKPFIFSDDTYRAADVAMLVTNTLISGGKVTPNSGSPLQLNITVGAIYTPGGNPNVPSNPNYITIAAASNIAFRALAGQSTLGGSITAVPVGSYDPNGAGVVTALPLATDATIHRLYYLYGAYVLAYGQQVYPSVENALSLLAVDRSKYMPSMRLADATLVAEIVATRSATDLRVIAQGAIVSPGGVNYAIGTAGGIADAPNDGTIYGRNSGAWQQSLEKSSPTVNNKLSIANAGSYPGMDWLMGTPGPGSMLHRYYSGSFLWFATQLTNPDDKFYFRSYNPATGVLRSTPLTLDLANNRVGVNQTAPTSTLDLVGSLGVTGTSTLSGNINTSGNLTFTANGARIFGNFTTTTPNRTYLQTTGNNSYTFVGAIPSGTGLQAGFEGFNNSTPTNSAAIRISASNTQCLVDSVVYGSGTLLPLNFAVDSTIVMGMTTAGDLQIIGSAGNFTWTKSTSSLAIANNVGANPIISLNKQIAGGGTAIEFRTSGSLVGTITTTGAATAYNTSSDYRLKEDVAPLVSSGPFIDALRPCKWRWKADGGYAAGFIAHELQEVSPSSVTGRKDDVHDDGTPNYQQVAYASSEIVAMLVAEVQALRKRVEQLESGE